MNFKEAYDILTTVVLALVPLSLLMVSFFIVYIPPEYIALVTLAIAIISQQASNQRVKDSVEIVKKWIRWDYITTILLAVWPIVVAYQPQIMVYVPTSLIIIVAGLFAFVSQWVADKREETSTTLE